jgi:hypothetical protein
MVRKNNNGQRLVDGHRTMVQVKQQDFNNKMGGLTVHLHCTPCPHSEPVRMKYHRTCDVQSEAKFTQKLSAVQFLPTAK